MSETPARYQPQTPPDPDEAQEVSRLLCDNCLAQGVECEKFSLILMRNGTVHVECDGCAEVYILEDWQDVRDIFNMDESEASGD